MPFPTDLRIGRCNRLLATTSGGKLWILLLILGASNLAGYESEEDPGCACVEEAFESPKIGMERKLYIIEKAELEEPAELLNVGSEGTVFWSVHPKSTSVLLESADVEPNGLSATVRLKAKEEFGTNSAAAFFSPKEVAITEGLWVTAEYEHDQYSVAPYATVLLLGANPQLLVSNGRDQNLVDGMLMVNSGEPRFVRATGRRAALAPGDTTTARSDFGVLVVGSLDNFTLAPSVPVRYQDRLRVVSVEKVSEGQFWVNVEADPVPCGESTMRDALLRLTADSGNKQIYGLLKVRIWCR